jgi:Sulfotransferase domain
MALNGRKVNLFIVGAAKSGTTSLCDWLDMHADVAMCRVKEPNFFATHALHFSEALTPPEPHKKYQYKIIKDKALYESLFGDVSNKRVIAEGSVNYLNNIDTPNKLYNYNPDAKIIILLRNPVERAYSHYIMFYNTGAESETNFLTALEKDQFRSPDKKLNYIEIGYYYKWIQNYLKYFPKQQILLLSFHELQENSREVLNRICQFAEIGSSSVSFPKSNVATPTYAFQRLGRRIASRSLILYYLYMKCKAIIGYKRLVNPPKHFKQPAFTPEARAFLEELYKSDTAMVEQFFLKEWLDKIENNGSYRTARV